ncbi:GlxA family transcriptional regulator [Mesorhizobium sp. M0213]|uniref:GlxA family transcriptional regulator n=1 Tax=Mesorhizobium sp. M0213 TaxID=2956917 RepID=UPI00333B10C2
MLAFTSAIEALRLANRVLGYKAFHWRLVSDGGGTVRASCGLSMPTDSYLALERKCLFGTDRPSMAIICADDNVEEYSNKSLEAWLRECKHRGIDVGALGTGTYVLAKAGLLANKRCTIHWEKLPGFAERFIGTVPNTSIYEIDGGIWTCAGGSASFDMMLHLIERDFGEQTAAGICELALLERVRAPGERQRLPLSRRCGILNETVIKAAQLMELHLTELLSMDDLAASVDLSRRQIERLFRRELDCSPVCYYRQLRLERAKLLLTQSTMPIVDIAVACGFISASHFSKCYRETNGTSPQEARKTRLRPAPHPVAAGPAIANVKLPRQTFVEAA